MADLALHLLALVAYPGLLLVVVFGWAAELATVVMEAGRNGAASAWVGTRPLRVPWAFVAAAVLAAVAATQLAIPYNPVTPVERDAVLAVVALPAAAWLSQAQRWDQVAARRRLVIHGCWLVAVVAPALLSQSLRPQVLGAVVVPAYLPLKIAAGLLYVVCLPAFLDLRSGDAPPAVLGTSFRALLWLPLCGLFTSLFLPPVPDDPLGLLLFLAITLGAAATAIVLGGVTGRWQDSPAERSLPRLAPALAALVLLIAGATTVLTS